MSDIKRQAALPLPTWKRPHIGTSNFTNPSLVSSNIPTLANPTRGFGLPTNNNTALNDDLQEAPSANEQLLEPEAIKEKPLVHDISRISLRRPQPQLIASQKTSMSSQLTRLCFYLDLS